MREKPAKNQQYGEFYAALTLPTSLVKVWTMRSLFVFTLFIGVGGCHQVPPSVEGLQTVKNSKYDLSCEAGALCPESVGLVVASHMVSETMRCTAALVASDRVLTAGHCVDRQTSPLEVWVGFPKANGYPQEWVASTEVLVRSSVEPGAGLLQPDYAVLRLDRALSRTPLTAFAERPLPGDVVRMVSVTPDRFYENKHHLAVRRCQVEDPRRAQPAYGLDALSVGWLSHCPIRDGNSGAPLLNAQGQLVGLVHGAAPPFFAVGVMTNLDFAL